MNIPIRPVDLEKVKTARGCMDWLSVCQAECCKFFRLPIGPRANGFRRGQVVKVRIPLDKDKIEYFGYHGCTYKGGVLEFKLDKFSVKNGEVSVHRVCDLLTPELKCAGHEDGRKPNVCKGLSKETLNNGQYVATPNCLYKYQLEQDG